MKRIALCFALVGSLAAMSLCGCSTSDAGTRIALSVTYDDAWGVTELGIDVDGKLRNVPAAHAVTLLVDDDADYDSTNLDLKHARWTGSSCSLQTVDGTGNVGASISLALDAHWTGRDGARHRCRRQDAKRSGGARSNAARR